MHFKDIKDFQPDLSCTCGHTAYDHLYCGEHMCCHPECKCGAFEVKSLPDSVLIHLRGTSIRSSLAAQWSPVDTDQAECSKSGGELSIKSFHARSMIDHLGGMKTERLLWVSIIEDLSSY